MQGDVLSDLLRSVRLSGAIFFEVDVAAPWVAAAPPSSSIAATLIPGAEHVIEYHVLVEGSCWARVTNPDGEEIELRPGSVIVFQHGDTHILASDPALRAEPDLGNFDQASRARSLPQRHAGQTWRIAAGTKPHASSCIRAPIPRSRRALGPVRSPCGAAAARPARRWSP